MNVDFGDIRNVVDGEVTSDMFDCDDEVAHSMNDSDEISIQCLWIRIYNTYMLCISIISSEGAYIISDFLLTPYLLG